VLIGEAATSVSKADGSADFSPTTLFYIGHISLYSALMPIFTPGEFVTIATSIA
jgi:hypothetical protein